MSSSLGFALFGISFAIALRIAYRWHNNAKLLARYLSPISNDGDRYDEEAGRVQRVWLDNEQPRAAAATTTTTTTMFNVQELQLGFYTPRGPVRYNFAPISVWSHFLDSLLNGSAEAVSRSGSVKPNLTQEYKQQLRILSDRARQRKSDLRNRFESFDRYPVTAACIMIALFLQAWIYIVLSRGVGVTEIAAAATAGDKTKETIAPLRYLLNGLALSLVNIGFIVNATGWRRMRGLIFAPAAFVFCGALMTAGAFAQTSNAQELFLLPVIVVFLFYMLWMVVVWLPSDAEGVMRLDLDAHNLEDVNISAFRATFFFLCAQLVLYSIYLLLFALGEPYLHVIPCGVSNVLETLLELVLLAIGCFALSAVEYHTERNVLTWIGRANRFFVTWERVTPIEKDLPDDDDSTAHNYIFLLPDTAAGSSSSSSKSSTSNSSGSNSKDGGKGKGKTARR